MTLSIGALFAGSMAGFVLYLTAMVRPQAPLMVLVGAMAVSGLLTVMLLAVVLFCRHPLFEKLRQKEAREVEHRFQTFFDQAPVGLALTTGDGRILAHNEALSDMLDYPGKDLIGLDARSIYSDREDRSRLLRLLKRSDLIENFESELRRRDGTMFVANITARCLSCDGEKVLHQDLRCYRGL